MKWRHVKESEKYEKLQNGMNITASLSSNDDNAKNDFESTK